MFGVRLFAESTLYIRERSFVAIDKVCLAESSRRQDAAPTCFKRVHPLLRCGTGGLFQKQCGRFFTVRSLFIIHWGFFNEQALRWLRITLLLIAIILLFIARLNTNPQSELLVGIMIFPSFAVAKNNPLFTKIPLNRCMRWGFSFRVFWGCFLFSSILF